MQCKFAFLCDYAQESGRKLHAVGIGWDTIYVRSFPSNHSLMCFVAVLQGTIAEVGTKSITLRLIDADGDDVITPMHDQIPFEVPPQALEANINFVVQLANLPFKKKGTYAIHLIVQGLEMASVRFHVAEPPTTA